MTRLVSLCRFVSAFLISPVATSSSSAWVIMRTPVLGMAELFVLVASAGTDG
jgi:hypothetical protein